MRLINLNCDSDIGASAWCVGVDGRNLLMDAGTHPKRDGKESMPLLREIRGETIDAIALTHCHHDHVGSLPVAMREHPEAHVLMTELSYFLVERVLHNSVNVMKRQKEELGIAEYPLFTHREVDELAPVFQGFRYNREIEWAAFDRGKGNSPTLEFLDAGHALGSAGIMVRGASESLFYTGDVCFQDQTILRGARFGDVKADVLVMETTRGNRATPADLSRENEIKRLVTAIREIQDGGGSVLIPSFALGRTQEILAVLALAMKKGELPRQPVFIGGLGRVFTEIYDLEAHRANRNHTNLVLNDALPLEVLDPRKAERMKLGKGRLFVMTAGMLSEGTAAHVLAARMLEEEEHGILFVGYADPETPGGRLKASSPGDRFFFSKTFGELRHRCRVEEYDLTAHANREELLDFVGQVDPRAVVLGHGDAEARSWFAGEIGKRHPGVKVFQPEPGETMEL
ncbi:MAG: MBL fold metallo-hydrolase [Verrucomicrobiae bacterium]|nr:MBL fold metallo-hydrolase [Verrucomicrobiae bacterium]